MTHPYDFSKYPVAEAMLKDTHLLDKAEQMRWTGTLNREQAAVAAAEMFLAALVSFAPNLSLRNQSKEAANHYFTHMNKNVNVIAQFEANAEIGISTGDMTRWFRHKYPQIDTKAHAEQQKQLDPNAARTLF